MLFLFLPNSYWNIWQGNLPVHNSMDALAAAALTYDYEEGPQLVSFRLDLMFVRKCILFCSTIDCQ